MGCSASVLPNVPFAAKAAKRGSRRASDIKSMMRRTSTAGAKVITREAFSLLTAQDFDVKENGNIAIQLLLSDEIAKKAISGWMESEHAEENTLFYDDAYSMDLESPGLFAAQLEALMKKYIYEGVDLEINISQKLRSRLIKSYDAQVAQETMYLLIEEAMGEVVDMLAGAFDRFQASKFYKDWKHEESKTDVEEKEVTLKTPEILLLNDSLPVIKITSRALIPRGYVVDYEGDPLKAFARLEVKHYAAIIVDMQHSGCANFVRQYRAFEATRTDHLNQILIGLTASSTSSKKTSPSVPAGLGQSVSVVGLGGLGAGGGDELESLLDGVLKKPFDMDAFQKVFTDAEIRWAMDLLNIF